MILQFNPTIYHIFNPVQCTKLIHFVYETHRQRKEDYQIKLQLRKKFYDILNGNLQIPFDLFIVGSSQTQFALNSSDMDLCMLLYDNDGNIDKRYMNDKAITIDLLSTIKDIIKESFDSINVVELVDNARVPILKIQTDSKFSRLAVDLNINGDISIRNTFLLAYYQ